MADHTENKPALNDLPKEWLLFRLSSLGDVVLCTGPMCYLNRRFGWTFAVLTRPAFAPVFENNPFVRELILPEPSQLKLPGSAAFFRQVARSHQGWGLLDLHSSLRSRILSFFWQGPVRRYPKFTAERRKFLRTRDAGLSAFLRATSVTQRYTMAALDSAPDRSELLPQLYLSDTEKAEARARLAAICGPQPGPLAVLHPFATHPRKAWPREYWLELIGMLEAANINWLIVGQGEALKPGDGRDLTGRTSLRELMALLAEANVVITGDSGPMHLAAAVGAPVVAMFGPTTAEWGFFPAGPEDKVLELPLSCRPCSLHGAAGSSGDRNCDRRCLGGISPSAVLEAALQTLGRSGSF